MATSLDDRMMGLAIRAARRGRPSPNPHVGAVIAHDDRVIAVGHHARAGQAHAEVAALAAAGPAAHGATLYVTLEPCNHFGRTPPCTGAIEAAGIRRVVVGQLDPAPHVPGATDRLRAAGIEVTTGVRERDARELVEDFSKHIRTGLPYVVLKAAVTLDGRMATRTGDSRWITSQAARKEAHRMRDRADAVLVGIGTVLADDPELTVRHVRGRSPLRCVVDSQLRTPVTSKLLNAPGGALVFHGESAPSERRQQLVDRGATLVEVFAGPHGLDLGRLLQELGARGVVRVLVEGGPTLHGALLDEGLADHASVFVAPRIVGDAAAPTFASGRGVDSMGAAYRIESPRVRGMGGDVLFDGPLARDPAGQPAGQPADQKES